MADEQLQSGPGASGSCYPSSMLRGSDLMFFEKQWELDAATAKLDELSQQLNQMWSDQPSPPAEISSAQEAKNYEQSSDNFSTGDRVDTKDRIPSVSSTSKNKAPEEKNDYRHSQNRSDTASLSLSLPPWSYDPPTSQSGRISPQPFNQVTSFGQSSPAHHMPYHLNGQLTAVSQKDGAPSPRSLVHPGSLDQSPSQRPAAISPPYESITYVPPSRNLPSSNYMKLGSVSSQNPPPHPMMTSPYEYLSVPAQLGRPSSPRPTGLPVPPLFSSERPNSGWPEVTQSSGIIQPARAQDDMSVRRKPQAHWGESDLDIVVDKKPSQLPNYDRAPMGYWSGPLGMQSRNWKESNLDTPILSGKDESYRLQQAPSYSTTLPKNFRAVSQQTDRRQEAPFRGHGSMASLPRSWESAQQPISRISMPPGSPQRMSRRIQQQIPLSVIFRLQNIYSAQGPFNPRKDLQGPERSPTGWKQAQPQSPGRTLRYGPVVGEKTVGIPNPTELGDVEPELENIFPASDTSDSEQVPRPLSPTRLQPVLPSVLSPEVKEVTDLEELMRIRAEIPRPLKRRGSLENPTPTTTPAQRKQYQQIIKRLFRRSSHKHDSELGGDTVPVEPMKQPEINVIEEKDEGGSTPSPSAEQSFSESTTQKTRSLLKKPERARKGPKRRARLHPLVLLLDAALIGELDIVQQVVQEISDPSMPNEEGITALHNAICGGNYSIVEFLISIGANVNATDSHGWTPLHCAASCNDVRMCTCLVKHGAAVFATTLSDAATATEKCDPYTEGYEECVKYLYDVEQNMGIANNGVVYALWDGSPENDDELPFREGDAVTILRRDDRNETEWWWWASLYGREGYVPKNFFGLFPKVRPQRSRT